MSPIPKLPDHYPVANASWEEKLSWLDASPPPFDRMREALPWLETDEQLGWWIEGMRDAISHPERSEALAELLGSALNRIKVPQ